MELTQKVDHFTVFKSFPSTSCCSQKFPPNNLVKNRLVGRARMFSLGRWVERDGLAEKSGTVQNCDRALLKRKTSLEGLCWLLNG